MYVCIFPTIYLSIYLSIYLYACIYTYKRKLLIPCMLELADVCCIVKYDLVSPTPSMLRVYTTNKKSFPSKVTISQ